MRTLNSVTSEKSLLILNPIIRFQEGILHLNAARVMVYSEQKVDCNLPTWNSKQNFRHQSHWISEQLGNLIIYFNSSLPPFSLHCDDLVGTSVNRTNASSDYNLLIVVYNENCKLFLNKMCIYLGKWLELHQ